MYPLSNAIRLIAVPPTATAAAPAEKICDDDDDVIQSLFGVWQGPLDCGWFERIYLIHAHPLLDRQTQKHCESCQRENLAHQQACLHDVDIQYKSCSPLLAGNVSLTLF